MVRLTRIYTRRGDRGETSLGDGSSARKDSRRVDAVGEVDELNSAVGVARAEGLDGRADGILAAIQNDLFDLGADLSVPESAAGDRLRVRPEQVARLEASCDEVNKDLPDLTSFVLPGGSRGGAALHLARATCRRAERAAVALAGAEGANPQAVIYLNRLSDLLFILARAANLGGREVLWSPGGFGPDKGAQRSADRS